MKRERKGGRTEGKVRQKEEVRGGSVIDRLIKKNPEKEINLEGTGEAQLSCLFIILFCLTRIHLYIHTTNKECTNKSQKIKNIYICVY